MDVQLYVYDLSRGMARQYSMALTGVHIDAIYHTSIVLGGVEYFFGQGVHRKVPGSTHHGRPMKVINLGQTHLPMEVVLEYVQSLESIYTPESYDLFMHNCNNFSQDLAMFLVGREIPEEIRKLPETFLSTPIGQMLRGQLDQSMRQMTQAPDAMSGRNASGSQSIPQTNGISPPAQSGITKTSTKPEVIGFTNYGQPEFVPGHVHNVTTTSELDRLLGSAQSTCACIFFTSATCPPCKIVYPAYDELAAEAENRATLIKVDVSVAYDIGSRYQIRGTPTFMTFLKGEKQAEWSGADEARLRGDIKLLIHMAHPQHAHTRLKLPSLHGKIQKPIMYSRVPPLEKLLAKIGPSANDKAIQDLVTFIRATHKASISSSSSSSAERGGRGGGQEVRLQDTAIPDLHSFSEWIDSTYATLPVETHFAVIDLLRIAAADPRISSYLVAEAAAAEKKSRILSTMIPPEKDYASSAYNLQATTLQLANNLFSSNVLQESLPLSLASSNDVLIQLRSILERLASTCLLAKHHNARSLAAALVYNLAAYDHNERVDGKSDKVDLGSMPDLEAALVEAVVNESENKETLHALLSALGLLLYAAPGNSGSSNSSSIWELCTAMEVRTVLQEKAKMDLFKGEELICEIGEELLAKGGGGGL